MLAHWNAGGFSRHWTATIQHVELVSLQWKQSQHAAHHPAGSRLSSLLSSGQVPAFCVSPLVDIQAFVFLPADVATKNFWFMFIKSALRGPLPKCNEGVSRWKSGAHRTVMCLVTVPASYLSRLHSRLCGEVAFTFAADLAVQLSLSARPQNVRSAADEQTV